MKDRKEYILMCTKIRTFEKGLYKKNLPLAERKKELEMLKKYNQLEIFNKEGRSVYVWIPSQEEIQDLCIEMIRRPLPEVHRMFNEFVVAFYDILEVPEFMAVLITYETFWLMFFMFHSESLYWDFFKQQWIDCRDSKIQFAIDGRKGAQQELLNRLNATHLQVHVMEQQKPFTMAEPMIHNAVGRGYILIYDLKSTTDFPMNFVLDKRTLK